MTTSAGLKVHVYQIFYTRIASNRHIPKHLEPIHKNKANPTNYYYF